MLRSVNKKLFLIIIPVVFNLGTSYAKDSLDVTVSTLIEYSAIPFTDGITIDDYGNLYVCDALGSGSLVSPNGKSIVKITPDLNISVYATGFSVPMSTVFDAYGNMYVASYLTNIKKVGADSTITSFSTLTQCSGIVIDSMGNLYVTRPSFSEIVKITPSGTISTFYTGTPLSICIGLTIDDEQNIYAANFYSGAIYKFPLDDPDSYSLVGTVPVTHQEGSIGFIQYNNGYIYAAGYHTCKIYRFNIVTGELQILAGTGQPGRVDGQGNIAQFNQPNGIAVSKGGDTVFVSDDVDKTLRMLIIRTITENTDDNPVKNTFELAQNYPNPFNPSTTISFSIENSEFIKLCIYNVGGELIRTLISELLPEGQYNLTWLGTTDHGQPVPAGIYYYSLQAEGINEVKKMILLK